MPKSDDASPEIKQDGLGNQGAIEGGVGKIDQLGHFNDARIGPTEDPEEPEAHGLTTKLKVEIALGILVFVGAVLAALIGAYATLNAG